MNESNDIHQDDSSSPPGKSSPTGEQRPIKVDAAGLSAEKEQSNADHEPYIGNASQFHPSEFEAALPEYIAFETPDGHVKAVW
jgi:hypothetical protein